MFIETVKILDGKIYNIKWHNKRFNQTRLDIFGIDKCINLEDYINPPKVGLFRCRIVYAIHIISIEYISYTPKFSKTFKIVQSDIDYKYKYNNREELNSLRESASGYNDIIIEKNGLLTDTTIANIAFYNGTNWITPKTPLLEGTVRAKLLKEGFLIAKDINSDDLKYFSNFALMNAMIGFQIQKNIIIYINTKEKICL
ncbi:MAG: aminotransferase class IV [Sulfurovaceae bacterium]|nr:aminotransferase class IV [Sulfurovaceae bacterium]